MNGSCQCGAVRFTTPTPEPLSLYHCHCIECRKQSASAFGTSAIFPGFSIANEPAIECWTRTTDAGRQLDCYFCKRCGTRVLHQRRGFDVVSVKAGCLDGDLDWGKASHIWCKRAVVPIPEGAVRFEAQPPETK
ncbi:Mss4-like protein [Lineolata rhizophorae]|uniref:Mss4-like protein n=1 Tax=Lineolata rhizophorae TaxID=578093 RepID=A0A6A6NQ75_9PEZI|nr:Mss4-like protein [Lineolata rhizophorae]